MTIAEELHNETVNRLDDIAHIVSLEYGVIKLQQENERLQSQNNRLFEVIRESSYAQAKKELELQNLKL